MVIQLAKGEVSFMFINYGFTCVRQVATVLKTKAQKRLNTWLQHVTAQERVEPKKNQ